MDVRITTKQRDEKLELRTNSVLVLSCVDHLKALCFTVQLQLQLCLQVSKGSPLVNSDREGGGLGQQLLCSFCLLSSYKHVWGGGGGRQRE